MANSVFWKCIMALNTLMLIGLPPIVFTGSLHINCKHCVLLNGYQHLPANTTVFAYEHFIPTIYRPPRAWTSGTQQARVAMATAIYPRVEPFG
jgi:hypothetical protein